MNDREKDVRLIENLYKNLTYFDQYSSSVLLFVIITICLLLAMSYCYIVANIQPIKDDWVNQRCKPYVIPFAGIINSPKDKTMMQFTSENFNYCTQNILKDVTGEALKPLTYISNVITDTVNVVKDSINAIRAMFDKVRTYFQNVIQEIMGRIMNVMIELQKIIISFKDFIGKVQGTLTAGLFTSLGTYYALKALLGAIAQFIITILIALAALILMFWVFPLTWGVAIANTAIFVSLSIPMALILTFMMDVLKVRTNLSLPGVPKMPSLKCFDKNTLFKLKNGEKKQVNQINLGDILTNNIKITSKIIVESKGSQIYDLNGIIVSDSHKVVYNGQLISVYQHPDATKIHEYKELYLYCFNTNTKRILSNSIEFADWDDLSDSNILQLNNLIQKYAFSKKHIHIDSGFTSNTQIKLSNGKSKHIKDIFIGDILEHGEKVYGFVEIDATNLLPLFIHDFNHSQIGINIVINSSFNNISLFKTNKLFDNLPSTLYHLLTDKNYFYVNNIKVYDYNACIEKMLEYE